MGLTTKFITNQVYYQQSIHAAIAHDRANHSPPGVEVEYSQHSCATVTVLTRANEAVAQGGNYTRVAKEFSIERMKLKHFIRKKKPQGPATSAGYE